MKNNIYYKNNEKEWILLIVQNLFKFLFFIKHRKFMKNVFSILINNFMHFDKIMYFLKDNHLRLLYVIFMN